MHLYFTAVLTCIHPIHIYNSRTNPLPPYSRVVPVPRKAPVPPPPPIPLVLCRNNSIILITSLLYNIFKAHISISLNPRTQMSRPTILLPVRRFFVRNTEISLVTYFIFTSLIYIKCIMGLGLWVYTYLINFLFFNLFTYLIYCGNVFTIEDHFSQLNSSTKRSNKYITSY